MTRAALCCACAVLLLAAVPVRAQTEAVTRVGPEGGMVLDPELRQRNAEAPPPRYRPLAPGLFGRLVLEEPSAGGDYRVQVWGLIVAPGARTEDAGLTGAAALTLRTGRVVLVTGRGETELLPGDVAAVPEGSGLRFLNRDSERPAHLRAVVLPGSP